MLPAVSSSEGVKARVSSRAGGVFLGIDGDRGVSSFQVCLARSRWRGFRLSLVNHLPGGI